MTPQRIGYLALAVYGLSILLANVLIKTVGIPTPGGTHLLPVGFGLMAPSGTVMAGMTFIARDLVQRTIGRRWSLLIILPGAAISALFDVHLALASGTAFLFSEGMDYLVYTPLQQRHFVWAVFLSGLAASVVDSILFLSLAGIPLAVALAGLLLGKLYVQVVFVPIARWLRSRVPSQQGAVRAVPQWPYTR